MLAEVETHTGLAPAEFRVLWLLVTAPDQTAPMNELSRALDFSTAGTTKLVDRLTCLGLVERRTRATDRRVTLAAITPSGVQLAIRSSVSLAASLRRHVAEPLTAEGFANLVLTVSTIAAEADDGPQHLAKAGAARPRSTAGSGDSL